jgi:hypothetical protein
VDATVVNANTISLVMPAHAAGNVEVAVIRAPGQAAIKVNGGFIYIGAPEIRELFPNIGSTAGGTILFISGVTNAATVTVDGIGTAFEWEWGTDGIYVTMPAHAAGAVDVIVTDQYGQTGSAVFTYASPDTFDFNGEWQGWTTPESNSLPVVLTIRDNMVVGVSCGNPSLTIDPASAVANGEFSFADSDGVSMTGKILSPKSASGTINSASCGNRTWSAWKK